MRGNFRYVWLGFFKAPNDLACVHSVVVSLRKPVMDFGIDKMTWIEIMEIYFLAFYDEPGLCEIDRSQGSSDRGDPCGRGFVDVPS